MASRPRQWTEAELTEDVAKAMASFRTERLAEPLALWKATFRTHEKLFRKLFDDFGLDDPKQLKAVHIAKLYERKLGDAFRYLAAPPISVDDLKVLAASTLTKKSLADRAEAKRVLSTILVALDPLRFPWVQEGRQPKPGEKEAAVLASAALMTAQRVATQRRNSGKDGQEQAVKQYLRDTLKLTEEATRTIHTLLDAPSAGSFCGESKVAGRKADIIVSLFDKRLLLLECKVSNSAINSVKRVNNDAGAKAGAWLQKLGEDQVVPAAMLSGVFKVHNLEQAQGMKLSLFWAHRLDDLGDFIKSTKPVHAKKKR